MNPFSRKFLRHHLGWNNTSSETPVPRSPCRQGKANPTQRRIVRYQTVASRGISWRNSADRGSSRGMLDTNVTTASGGPAIIVQKRQACVGNTCKQNPFGRSTRLISECILTRLGTCSSTFDENTTSKLWLGNGIVSPS